MIVRGVTLFLLLSACQLSPSARAVRTAERFVFALTGHSNQSRNEACNMLDRASRAELEARAHAAVALGASRANGCDMLSASSVVELSERDRAIVTKNGDVHSVTWNVADAPTIDVVWEDGRNRVRLPRPASE